MPTLEQERHLRCRYGNLCAVYGRSTTSLHVASILNNVVLYQQDVKEGGVGQYVDEAKVMMQGEKSAAITALEAWLLSVSQSLSQ